MNYIFIDILKNILKNILKIKIYLIYNVIILILKYNILKYFYQIFLNISNK
jgi:hypothetical protein